MKLPLISIIIPTLNVESTLQRALDSIINQSYMTWEVLLLDGVSNDRTLKIAKSYKENNINQISIYSSKDRGIYDAMNKGIDLANGEWIYFLGADDFLLEKNTLESVVELIDKEVYDVIYGNVISFYFNDIYAGEFTYSKFEKQNICHQAIFFNKKVFTKIGKFNLKYKVLADWEHNIRWFYNNNVRYKYINIIIANYSGDGFSSVNKDKLFELDKLRIIFTLGQNFLGLNKLISLSSTIINENRLKGEKKYFFYYSFIRFYLKILRKFNITFKF